MKAGVTGHQELGDASTTEWVRAELGTAIRRHGVTHGVTSLAKGADQLFASLLRESSIPFTVVIPSRHYDTTFGAEADKRAYENLRAAAKTVVQLDYPEPDETAFFAAGKEVVERADLILAVWDGDKARGLGGTGDIVDYASRANKRIVQINPRTKEIRAI